MSTLDERLALKWPSRRPALPRIAPIGGHITWTQGDRARSGMVIDRAPNDMDPQPYSVDGEYRFVEVGGYWVWVLPDEPWADDEGCMVRLRCFMRGRDAGTIERAPLQRLDGEQYTRTQAHRLAYQAYRRANRLDYIEDTA